MAQVQLISGPERRRRWIAEQKRAIVEAAFASGAVVSHVARRADVCANQLYAGGMIYAQRREDLSKWLAEYAPPHRRTGHQRRQAGPTLD